MRRAFALHTRRILLHFSLFFASGLMVVGYAQTSGVHHYWILLQQRTPATFSPRELGISERALNRRAKVLPADKLIDQFDYPIPSAMLDQIRSTGATIRVPSRWLNAVSVEATDLQLRAISKLPFVASTRPVIQLFSRKPEPVSKPISSSTKLQKSADLNYGLSFDQLNNIHVVALHNLGINGSGVLLGMLDDGFNNHHIHVALKNIHVLAEYDFIHNIPDTQAQPWEDPGQGVHGAGTLSSIAGYDPGNLIGGAFGVSVILAKTEMDSSGSGDFRSEEDTYAAGLEWMERLGADIASSSLGYKEFTPSDSSYGYSSMDGHTAIVSKAATIAARKGLLLCTAMGNEGIQTGNNSFSLGTIVAPADADSIVSVGAASLDGTSLASFSSTGPTADGRTKPEVVAPGENVSWAYGNSTNQYWTVQGTSAATPLTASAAALILSAHPEFTPMQIRQALMSTAVPLSAEFPNLPVPNNYVGYGFINAYSAVLSDGLVFSNSPIITTRDSSYVVTTWVASTSSLVAASLVFSYRYPTDSVFTQVLLNPSSIPNEYQAIIPKPPIGVIPLGYFSARDAVGVRTSPFNAPNSLFSIALTPDSLRQLYPIVDSILTTQNVPTDYVLLNNFPNPFNPSTTLQFYALNRSDVDLTVYNLLGQRVKTLFHGTPSVGWNTVRWVEARDDNGRSVSSGVYFARLSTAKSVLTQKMLYVK